MKKYERQKKPILQNVSDDVDQQETISSVWTYKGCHFKCV